MSPRPSLPAGSGSRASASSAAAIEEGFVRRIQTFRPRPSSCCSSRRPSRSATPRCFSARRHSWAFRSTRWRPAEAAGVIEFGPRMRFHHPLMRSAAYRAADLTERRVDPPGVGRRDRSRVDPDRRAWHAANAAAGPDDAVAAELETSAGRAQSRGGVAAAAAFLERAAILTSDPALRGSRATRRRAGQTGCRGAGGGVRAARDRRTGTAVRAPARPGGPDARADGVRPQPRRRGRARRRPTDAAAQLLSAAKGLENLDDDLARETYLEALAAAMYAGGSANPADLPRSPRLPAPRSAGCLNCNGRSTSC